MTSLLTREAHSEHPLHPLFQEAGMQQSPCTNVRCDDHDKEHAEALDGAESNLFDRKSDAFKPHRLDLKGYVGGMEAHANPDTLDAYTADPSSRKSPTPWAMKHKGKWHIQNGHHAVAAAMRRGDSHFTLNGIDMDEEH